MTAVLTLLAVGICMPALAAIVALAALLIPTLKRQLATLTEQNLERKTETAKLMALVQSSRQEDDLESLRRRVTELEMRRNLR
jgi:nitrate reductase NapAB chaperone NapD